MRACQCRLNPLFFSIPPVSVFYSAHALVFVHMRESFGECVHARVSGCLYLNIIQTHKWRSCQRRWEHTVHKDLLSRSFSFPLSFFSPFFTLWGTHGISLVLLPHRDKWAHVCLYVWAHCYICLCENHEGLDIITAYEWLQMLPSKDFKCNVIFLFRLHSVLHHVCVHVCFLFKKKTLFL